MTDTTTERPCSFPGCDEPAEADGACVEHWKQFNTAVPPVGAEPRGAVPADRAPNPGAPTPSGRLRLAPMFAVVRCYYSDPGVMAVYGAYGSEELAQRAAGMLTELGIPDKLEVVPFYEVTP